MYTSTLYNDLYASIDKRFHKTDEDSDFYDDDEWDTVDSAELFEVTR